MDHSINFMGDKKPNMGRMLSIDYGTRRTGLATTDPEKRLATQLCTLPTEEVLPFLRDYVAREPVQGFVLGAPKTLSGKATHATAPAQKFAATLRHHFPKLPVHWIDERLSSVEAQRVLLSAGLPKKKRAKKELVDSVAAVLILQNYLAHKK